MTKSNREAARDVLRGYVATGSYKTNPYSIAEDYMRARYPRIFGTAYSVTLVPHKFYMSKYKYGHFNSLTNKIKIIEITNPEIPPRIKVIRYVKSMAHELTHSSDCSRNRKKLWRDNNSFIHYHDRPCEKRAFRRGRNAVKSFEKAMVVADPEWNKKLFDALD